MAREAGLSEGYCCRCRPVLVHDIGKVVIPDNIIYKGACCFPGAGSDAEASL